MGLGEEWDEVVATLRDLRAAGCQIVTIGQYLRPSLANLPMVRYYTPAEFAELKRIGLELGFGHVESGPLVRSSYHAHEQTAGLRSRGAERAASRAAFHATPSRIVACTACARLRDLLRAHRAGEESRASRRHLLGHAGPGIRRSATRACSCSAWRRRRTAPIAPGASSPATARAQAIS